MDGDTTVCKAIFALVEDAQDFSKSKLLWCRFVDLHDASNSEVTRSWNRGILWLRCDKEKGRRIAQVCLAIVTIDPVTGNLEAHPRAPVFGCKLDAKSLCDHMDRAGYDVDEEDLALLNNLARACAKAIQMQPKFEFWIDEKSQKLHLGIEYADGGATNLTFGVLARRGDHFMVKFMLDVAFSLYPEETRQEIHQRYVLNAETENDSSWVTVLSDSKTSTKISQKEMLTPQAARRRKEKISQEFMTQGLALDVTQTLLPVDSFDLQDEGPARSSSHIAPPDQSGTFDSGTEHNKGASAEIEEDAVIPRPRKRVKTGRRKRHRGFAESDESENNEESD
mmetsp:Transcript_7063/g.14184  ORF Transcript_7063/g.14184 Transcript_7063/m.14184 type:complete len:337 (-) Transcript_7063:76-1086(-)